MDLRALVALFLTACLPTQRPLSDALRARVHYELRCPHSAIQVVPMGAGGYWVSACARTATFSCMRRWEKYQSGYTDTCTREGEWMVAK
jgi:hypothetical protein